MLSLPIAGRLAGFGRRGRDSVGDGGGEAGQIGRALVELVVGRQRALARPGDVRGSFPTRGPTTRITQRAARMTGCWAKSRSCSRWSPSSLRRGWSQTA
jgi:hypothetical protein